MYATDGMKLNILNVLQTIKMEWNGMECSKRIIVKALALCKKVCIQIVQFESKSSFISFFYFFRKMFHLSSSQSICMLQ